MEPKWTNLDEITKDLSYLDDFGANYGPMVELITGCGRGSKKSGSNPRNPRRSSPKRPGGLLDRNGDPIELDEEECSSYENVPIEDEPLHGRAGFSGYAPVRDEDLWKSERDLQKQMRKTLGNPMDNTSIESYIKAKARTSPKKWHSAGSDSSSSFFEVKSASSLDGKSSYRKGHRKRESTKEEPKKTEKGRKLENKAKHQSDAKSPVEKKKSNDVFEIAQPFWKKDRSSQNALITTLLEKNKIVVTPETSAKENSAISLETEQQKYVPPYRRNRNEDSITKNETESDADVIVEDDMEDFKKINTDSIISSVLEKLSPPSAKIKASKNIFEETQLDVMEFKKKFMNNYLETVNSKKDEEEEEEEEIIEKNIGKITVASIQSNKMELNNNDPEKELKYENLAKKVLENKNHPRMVQAPEIKSDTIYDFHKFTRYNSWRQNSQNGQRRFKDKNSGTQSPYIKSKVFYNKNRRKGKRDE